MKRVLDPVERLSEVLFGLIMVLSFTGSISAASDGHEEVRTVLIGAIGCNLAWGLVDAVMYLMAILIGRARGLRVVRAVRAVPEAERGRALIADELPEAIGQLVDTEEIESMRRRLLALEELPARPSLTKRDWTGALAVFLLVFLSTFPVVLPFLFFSPLHWAMRASNSVAILMLYVAGHQLAKHAGLRPVRTGFAMVAVGLVLVALTIALGG
jgi:VIT1/CCC1 family predicted Fe2+/Mn2+ transporter